MKKLGIIFLCLLMYHVGVSQKNADIGLMLGGATYMGDVNQETPFRSVKPAASAFYRYNFHSRLALKGSIQYARIAGDDALSEFDYQTLRNQQFSTDMLGASAFVEFNFLHFEQTVRHRYATPYIGAGLGFMLVDFKLAANTLENITIPFGLGVKIGLTERLAMGLEYTLHKTFRDDLDKISDWRYNSSGSFPLKQRANPQNDDWFTFFGVFLSYKLKDCVTCPAYL